MKTENTRLVEYTDIFGDKAIAIVKANKNLGICDINKCFKKYQEDPKTKKRIPKLLWSKRLSTLLSNYQGRQINDENVIESLKNRLEEGLYE